MIGKIFITRHGYDPQKGKHVKDPYLGKIPSIGACRTDIRRVLNPGDHLFVISGKIPQAGQFVIGGFEVDRKIPAIQAYHEFPDQRLHLLPDGQRAGNVIVNHQGMQHELDDHDNFDRRVQNYIIGKNPILLESDEEISRGRGETMEALCEILKKNAKTPFELIGRSARNLNENQIIQLRDWLSGLKEGH